MAKYVLKAEPIVIKLTPYGFHKYAKDYFSVAESLAKNVKYSPVPYFLYCRTIELGLKAFLLAKGKTPNWVREKLWHDLTKALMIARQYSLDEFVTTTSRDETQIMIANKYYEAKGFEYFFVLNHVTGLKDLPDLLSLKNYAKKLLIGIKDFVKDTA
jgi:hypothetical protein